MDIGIQFQKGEEEEQGRLSNPSIAGPIWKRMMLP